MKKWQKALVIVLCIVLVWGVIAVFPRTNNPDKNNIFIDENRTKPILIAHGGGNREFPDNTLEAFCNAYEVDENMMLETDVSITSDGVIVLTHDTSIDRKTNESGMLIDWSYADLIGQRVDFGYANETVSMENGGRALKEGAERVKYTDYKGEQVSPTDVTYPQTYVDAVAQGKITPRDTEVFLATTLEDLLIVFPNNSISVEIKQSGEIGLSALEAVMNLAEEYDAFDRIVFASFHKEVYDKIKEYNKQRDDMMFSPEENGVIGILVTGWIMVDLFYFEPITLLQVPMEELGINLATRHFVNTAHRHNIAVHYWTVDEQEDMEYLIEIGADGIMTNLPHLLKQVLDSVE